MRPGLFLPAIAVCLVFANSTDLFAQTGQPPRNIPGRKNQTTVVGTLNRTFVVYVGSSVGPTMPAPVVFMLHGTSGDGDKFYNISRWKEKADEVGLIAVFPDALTYCFHEDENGDGDFVDPDELKITTKWTHGELGDPARMPFCSTGELAVLTNAQKNLVNHPFQDDVLFFDAMISFLRSNYVVDEKRIFVSGFSNGAQMSSRLAAERSSAFAAIGAHAGFLLVPPVPGRPMTFVSSIGSLDDRATASLGIAELPLTESAVSNPAIKARYITPMLQQLHLADVYTYDEPIISGKKTSRFTYKTSTAGALNVFYFSIIDDNDHNYPNGENHPVVMANVLWSIFATTQLPGNELPFTIPNRGGVTKTTSGSGTAITSGYGRIQPDFGSTTPTGLAIFGFTQNGVLVSEAAVPASPLIQSGRIYAEIGGNVNTGVAIANPNPQPSIVDFYFTDAAGVSFNTGSMTVSANGQTSAFLNQSPFSSAGTSGNLANTRSFTFRSSRPVSMIALRGLTNERGEFLITTLPVSAIDVAGTASSIFPYFADGGGWTTQIILVNPTDGLITGAVQFFSAGASGSAGAPIPITANGTTASSFAYSVPPRSSYKLATAEGGSTIRSGSVRVVPAPGSQAPAGVVVFGFRNGAGIVVTEAGVPALPVSSSFRLYVEGSGNFNAGQAGSIQSGFAIANSAAGDARVTLELTYLDGSPTGLTGTATVPSNGQVAMFLNQVSGLQSLPASFRGVLRVSGSGISVTGLRGRYNERGDFLITSTSPVDESSPTTTAEYMFPHIVNGGGYTTQFILFNGSAGQATSGRVFFFTQTSQPLSID